jgi:hypothetical protein
MQTTHAPFSRESLEAYFRARDFRERTVRVIGLFYVRPLGLTQDEAAAEFGVLTQTMSPIFTDLSKRGIIIHKPVSGTNDYETRPTRSNSPAGVHLLSPNWQKAAEEYRDREETKRKSRKMEKEENARMRDVIASLVEIIEVSIPFKDEDLTESLEIIRKEFLQ